MLIGPATGIEKINPASRPAMATVIIIPVISFISFVRDQFPAGKTE
jgi:hypothetical protein